MKGNERFNNIHVIDTNMCDLERYCAAYIVEGKELALIDTGYPSQLEVVRAGIKAHGFNISDISYIFITHCEHPDHAGNVAPLLREAPNASVYINPVGLDALLDPSKQRAMHKARLSPERVAQIGKMEPVPRSRIKLLNDGDIFDLGNGEKLTIIFAPGHQPSGIVILEEKNNGLFINDLLDNYFADADAHYCLNSERVDHQVGIETIKKLMDLPVSYLYLGHYGIIDQPKKVMKRAIENKQRLLDMGKECIEQGRPEDIPAKVCEFAQPELEKLRAVRGEKVYQYSFQGHVPGQANIFAKYCQEKFGK